MIAVAGWAWGLLGIVVFLGLGLLLMLVLGLLGAPGDFFRRAGQTAAAPRAEQGAVVPDEVPASTAEETTKLVEREQRDT